MNAVAVQQAPRLTRVQPAHRRGLTVAAPTLARAAGSLLVVSAAIVIVFALAASPQQPRPVTWSSISVGHTGTLWEIAAEHGVEGLSTAETVDLIRKENGLSSSTLYSGQTLIVPAAGSEPLSVAQR